jgi:hypothetical protein
MPSCPHCETIITEVRRRLPDLPKEVIMVDINHLWKQIAEGKYTKVQPLLEKIKWVPQMQTVPIGVPPVETTNEPVTLTSADQLIAEIDKTKPPPGSSNPVLSVSV